MSIKSRRKEKKYVEKITEDPILSEPKTEEKRVLIPAENQELKTPIDVIKENPIQREPKIGEKLPEELTPFQIVEKHIQDGNLLFCVN